MEPGKKLLTEGTERFLSVLQASARTNLSKSTIYKLIYDRVLHRVRLPGCKKVLIRESELERFIQEGVEAGLATVSA